MGIRRAQLLMKLLHVGLKPVQRERESEKLPHVEKYKIAAIPESNSSLL